MSNQTTLFTVGPVQMDPEILAVGSRPLPYFRTADFSQFMHQLEVDILSLAQAPRGAKSVLLTCSGTGAMEACVAGLWPKGTSILVVDGGSFGHRFYEMAKIHGLDVDVLTLPFTEDLTLEHLKPYTNKPYKALYIQAHETSIGKKYPLKEIGEWCQRQNILLIVDAVSAFLVDPIDMTSTGIDVLLTTSQKALALPPGLSLVVLSPKALEQVNQHTDTLYYLSLKQALLNAKRGQTPFTPALSLIYQLRCRIDQIKAQGGVSVIVQKTAEMAAYFRQKVADIPAFTLPSYTLSNGLTPLLTGEIDAYQLFLDVMHNHGIVLTPCGGDLAQSLIRVGHMGYLQRSDYDRLLIALAHYSQKRR